MRYKELLKGGWLTYCACIGSIIIMPLHVRYLPPFMILWGLFWILENISKINQHVFWRSSAKILFISFIIFYGWQIFGLIFANLIDNGFEKIFKRLSFFLFPLVLFSPGDQILKNIKQLLRIFALCTLLFIVFSFCFALYRSIYFQSGSLIFNPHPPVYDYENYFYGSLLSINIHPSYLSMFVVMSVLISVDNLFDRSLKFFFKVLWIIIILIFITALYFLSSRAGVLAGLVIIPICFVFKLKRKLSIWVLSIILPIILILILGSLRTNERLNYSIEEILKYDPGNTIIKENRIPIWKSAIGVIKNNVIFGVGTGDATAELKKEFKRRGYVDGYYENLNAHNQYLEIFLENGLIGLIIFIWIIGFMLYIAFINRNILYGLFIIMVMIFFIFETMLNTITGITFFAMFSFLLLHLNSGSVKSSEQISNA